jgi:signal peptidase II
MRGRGVLNFALVLSSVFVLDLLSKVLVRARMPLGSEIALLPFFSIVHVTNTGIAFGMFQNNNRVFAVVGVAVAAALIVYALKIYRDDRASGLLMALIVGGAIGNLFDRVVHGRVTDFLDFYAGPHHWPAFNVADSAICVGAAFLFVRGLRKT